MVDISIVIVSWNVREFLAQCLESLQTSFRNTHSPLHYDIWVVDNHSRDGSVEMILDRFPDVRLIASEENLGFAGGNNQAIQSSDSRYVLLLNPDTQVLPGAIENLVAFMDKNPQAGAAGSLLLNPDGSLQTSCYPFPTLTREFWRLMHLDLIAPYGVYRMADWDQTSPRQTDIIQGASLVLRRETLTHVGLLDTNYFMYTEEVDLCYRISKGGWQLWWVPESRVIHYGGQSTAQVSSQMFLCLYQSKLHFFRKHYGRKAALLYKAILMVTGLARLIFTPLTWLGCAELRNKNLDLAQNYWRLLTKIHSW
jgi:N-acetylglucosaminyl-diphospho-decaprenol L-rhamnosyltransferase